MAAHVDAGKTTLSEALLYRAGAIRRLGRVDNGDAFLDGDPQERSRGITIFSKQAILRINDTEMTLLDTPGHVDFSAETERAFTVPDCAVLVISGTDGVQSHTRTLWELLRRFGIPTFVFVNKMDISHKSNAEILLELHKLDKRFADFSENAEELCAELDEDCMNALLERGEVPSELIARAISARNVFPVLFGSALKSEGIDGLLELLERYAEPRERHEDFAALVYKITSDENGVRLTHMKINGGELKNRAVIGKNGEKVTQIRLYNGAKFTAVDRAEPGQLVAVTGLSETFAGQALGAQKTAAAPLIEPVLGYRVELPPETDVQVVLPKLKKLEDEDPQLRFSWSEQLREIHVSVMGEVQLEVLQNVIAERFGLSVTFGRGSVAYRETVAEKVEGVGHYEPLRHYAEVHVLIEPLPRGSGVVFARDCRDLDENWQRLALSNLRERCHIGVLTGSPLTDVKITLAAGRAHLKHTEGGDFRQAAWRAVRQGLASAKSVLLEPFCRFTLEIPVGSVGRAMTDLQQMGAEFAQPSGSGELSVIEGRCPVSEMRGYQKDVIGYTRGTGRLSTIFDGYYPCHNAQEVIEKIGYNFENDVENSADSVFCSHGAGYLVKWNDVPSKMHIPSVLCEKSPQPITQLEINSYKQRLATDKELMEIFERTYGKIKRENRTAIRRDKLAEKPTKLPPPKRGSEFLLVDGYNIIFSWDELAKIAKDDLDLARSRLINIMCNYQGFKNCNLILVFDAYKVKSDREVEKFGNVSVVYTREAETADMYIEKTAQRLSADNRVRVATSDGTEQLIILGAGATRVSAREFKLEVDEVELAIREILDKMHK
ncbi:MAG: TetM/TetW/TetO/TetS family tetracycline resistance ribosomal protection protein [Lachnospiraceae bacterium]|nr:TetM/TetW/TetO/TetS family tetracycline resistance ribosomal protection protein [Ruminococcus sp.]MCM1275744.1 TetM/TetW/TetO/TetS family tetracycline resistance ribosomal protection protein [Lachnospiraceae bacterium]